MPKRIQRKRTKGWRLPPNTVCVDRSTRWGNPYKVGAQDYVGHTLTHADAVKLYRADVSDHYIFIALARDELGGKDLACWCPLDKPCHADILLEIVNA